MMNPLKKILIASALGLALTSIARADRVELTNGSVVLGKVVSAEKGKFKVETDFAGTIEIDEKRIKTFVTDEAVNVSLDSGSTLQGKVEAATTGEGVAIVAPAGTLAAKPDEVSAIWRVGDDSPAIKALKAQRWRYEASLAISGRTGGSEKFGGVLGFKATRETTEDKLIFDLQAEKAQDNGVETANRQFAGVDYSSFFSPKNIWYARTSIEKDAIKAIDLRSSTAFGVGRKLIKRDVQDLELRVGLSYLYESYANGTDFDSPGMDFALLHTYTFKTGKLSNSVSYTPTFEDFNNYRLHHESSYEMPLTASLWKLKIGVANDYTSTPQPGISRLDTLYFTSLILNWQQH